MNIYGSNFRTLGFYSTVTEEELNGSVESAVG